MRVGPFQLKHSVIMTYFKARYHSLWGGLAAARCDFTTGGESFYIPSVPAVKSAKRRAGEAGGRAGRAERSAGREQEGERCVEGT